MGKVFTRYEIENGLYPRDGGHDIAVTWFMEGMNASQQEDTAHDYMVYGSVVEGRENVRSDADVLIIIPDKFAVEAFNKAVQLMSKISAVHNVAFEPNIMSVCQAQSGHHDVDVLYGSCLRDNFNTFQHTKYVTGNPVDCIRFNGSTNPRESLARYFATGKFRRFANAAPSGALIFDAHVYQRALELPARAVQKFKQAGLSEAPVINDLDYQALVARNLAYSRLLAEIISSKHTTKVVLDCYEKSLMCDYEHAVIEAGRLSIKGYALAQSGEWLL